MTEKITTPAQELESFLNFIDQCCREYQAAYDEVGYEEKKLQD